MTIVTNGSYIHVYARAHTHVYTSICKSIVTFVTGEDSIALDNLPRVGGWSALALVKHKRVRCPQSHAGQVKLPNSLITQHPDQIVDWIWSLVPGFSWAATIPEVS